MNRQCPHCTSTECQNVCRFYMKPTNAAPQVPGSSVSTGAEVRVQSPGMIGEPLSQKTPNASPADAAFLDEQTIVDIARHCGGL